MRKAYLPFGHFFLPSILLVLIGGGGLYYTIFNELPTLGPRWLFFFFLVVLITGIFLPLSWLFNARFPTTPPVEAAVVLREALWFGIYIALLAWFQLGRVLNLPLAVILAAAFLLIEVLLRIWEHSRWQPTEESQE